MVLLGRVLCHEQRVLEAARGQQAAAEPAEEAEAFGLVEPRAGEAGGRGPGERAAGVLAASDVEGAVDDHVELESGARPELEQPDAPLDAVAERQQPYPGSLLQAADRRESWCASSSVRAARHRHGREAGRACAAP